MRVQFHSLSWVAMLPVLVGLGATVASAKLGPVAPLPDSTSDPGAVPWKAVATAGPVEALPADQTIDQWIRVRRGDRLNSPAAVRTGRRGRATLIQNASILMLDPNSRVSLPRQGEQERNSSVVQEYGSVIYEIEGEMQSGFRVVTPHLVAGAKGTVFLVTVTESRAVVTVREGIVEVIPHRTGELSEVRAGETMLVDSEELSDMELDSAERTSAERSRQSAKLARVEERKIDRAMNRLGADLTAYRVGVQHGGFGRIDEIDRFLSGELDKRSLEGKWAETADGEIEIDDLDKSYDDLIQDLSNEERERQIEPNDPAGTSDPQP